MIPANGIFVQMLPPSDDADEVKAIAASWRLLIGDFFPIEEDLTEWHNARGIIAAHIMNEFEIISNPETGEVHLVIGDLNELKVPVEWVQLFQPRWDRARKWLETVTPRSALSKFHPAPRNAANLNEIASIFKDRELQLEAQGLPSIFGGLYHIFGIQSFTLDNIEIRIKP